MRTTRRWGAAVATGLAAGLLLTACASSAEEGGAGAEAAADGLTPVKLQLQWLTQAQFAGYYAAQEQGYYADEGLDVEILPSGGDIVPQDALAQGEVDYAIAWVPKVLGSIEQGAGITNVAQVFERSATLQVAFADSGIDSVADLSGKTVGSWGYGNEWELFAGLNKAGVTDFQLVTQAFDMLGLLNGDIDAAQAMTYNEYAQLLETVDPDTGELYTPDDFTVIDWNDEGTAMLQDAIWADSERLADDAEYQETTVKFLKASLKGWVYARDNAQAAADAVTAAGSTLGTSHQLWMTNEVNKLIWPSTSGGIGLLDESAWKRTVALALQTRNETGASIISAEPPESAYTTEYVTKALAELEDEGVDVVGASWKPESVTLAEGGN
ncbi:ABC transporter substrate-binding protein [Cellulomonas chengniuliangii]|uniref:Thiamine pyrimidine synthase n=1 Tax=Cellulomonas chengniuliangii TaxID=2968084 RepID=A0ABY5KVL6_9CELL|nr:ABC transporter substrate-binding protein [Cellulomonas chengniuliangii]MCC2309018.1 ABC transporter substrate-binding protein [Cellulomonas chengniuliangii]MCC2319343.1 ABC transporter substrate-binding protein [Cellulomonas chengniuliangii]UUI74249.1 ABC transporter substrate-binding protein [Cellulomonas chengniuliangii]